MSFLLSSISIYRTLIGSKVPSWILALMLVIALISLPLKPALAASSDQPTEPDWTVAGAEAGDKFGHAVSSAGDVNGDGFDDLLITAMGYPFENSEGKVYLFHGGPNGPAQEPDWALDGTYEYERMGTSAASAGDVNGDGFDDVLVGAPGFDYDGSVFLYYGGEDGLSLREEWSIAAQSSDESLGTAVAAADVNGDGFIDIFAGASDFRSESGIVYVFYGTADGYPENADWGVIGGEDAELGLRLETGDLNGDGYADVAMGGVNSVSIYYGSEEGLSIENSTGLAPQDDSEFGKGFDVGDANGDGIDDIAVGDPQHEFGNGAVRLFAGTEDGVDTKPIWALAGEDGVNHFGGSVAILESPVRGLLIGSESFPNYAKKGKATFYESGADGPGTISAWTLLGEAEETFFGSTVAHVGDINGDGAGDIAISAAGIDAEAGQVQLYLSSGSGSTKAATPAGALKIEPLWQISMGEEGENPLSHNGYANGRCKPGRSRRHTC